MCKMVGAADSEDYDLDDSGSTDCIHACTVCPWCDCTCRYDWDDPKCVYHTWGDDTK